MRVGIQNGEWLFQNQINVAKHKKNVERLRRKTKKKQKK